MKPKQVYFSILILFIFFAPGCRNTATHADEKSGSGGMNVITDSLPGVFAGNNPDIIDSRLKNEAYKRFITFQLPETRQEWDSFNIRLRKRIIEKAGITINHELPLLVEETGTFHRKGVTVKNIIFQTLPGLFATASLYVPDGNGPFPAIVNMHGHWREARLCGPVQSVGITLALHGYVSIAIDAFGAGERSDIYGEWDYHGANPGASLMNIGKTLLGIQVSENMRCVDLLCSLPYVDAERIGATGASGGGNQTMWLTAVDERVKAAVSVVSIGTFESYVMNSNCVCELLPDGLTLSEESGILSIIAPRAFLMCNHKKDLAPTFFPSEMLRTFNNAKPVFEMLGVKDHIGYRIFDLEHDYAREDREAMLGWFNLHLKGTGNGESVKETPFEPWHPDQLKSFPGSKRDSRVMTMEEFCRKSGGELRNRYLEVKTVDIDMKKKQLLEILRIQPEAHTAEVHQFDGRGGWDRFMLETSDGRLIPLLHLTPRDKSGGYVILCDPQGKTHISSEAVRELIRTGKGIVIPDLSGTGECASQHAAVLDDHAAFHTISRADLWLGKTVLGEWATELNIIAGFLKSKFNASVVTLDAGREVALAALFSTLIGSNETDTLILRNAPPSYLFDSREGIDFFNMSVHLPGLLVWGDISLAAALSNKNITFIDPVSMSGKTLSPEKLNEYQIEFNKFSQVCGRKSRTIFK